MASKHHFPFRNKTEAEVFIRGVEVGSCGDANINTTLPVKKGKEWLVTVSDNGPDLDIVVAGENDEIAEYHYDIKGHVVSGG